MTLIGLDRPHDLNNFSYSFQLNCLHQGYYLFKKKQEYSLIKVFEIYYTGFQCPIFHKIGNARGAIETSTLGVYHSWKTTPETG